MSDKPRRKKFGPRVLLDIWLRQNGRCACGCKEKLQDGMVEYDHEKPLWLGGEDTPDNLRALIKKHHLKKTQAEATMRAKTDRQRAKHFGPRLNATEREIQRIRIRKEQRA